MCKSTHALRETEMGKRTTGGGRRCKIKQKDSPWCPKLFPIFALCTCSDPVMRPLCRNGPISRKLAPPLCLILFRLCWQNKEEAVGEKTGWHEAEPASMDQTSENSWKEQDCGATIPRKVCTWMNIFTVKHFGRLLPSGPTTAALFADSCCKWQADVSDNNPAVPTTQSLCEPQITHGKPQSRQSGPIYNPVSTSTHVLSHIPVSRYHMFYEEPPTSNCFLVFFLSNHDCSVYHSELIEAAEFGRHRDKKFSVTCQIQNM